MPYKIFFQSTVSDADVYFWSHCFLFAFTQIYSLCVYSNLFSLRFTQIYSTNKWSSFTHFLPSSIFLINIIRSPLQQQNNSRLWGTQDNSPSIGHHSFVTSWDTFRLIQLFELSYRVYPESSSSETTLSSSSWLPLNNIILVIVHSKESSQLCFRFRFLFSINKFMYSSLFQMPLTILLQLYLHRCFNQWVLKETHHERHLDSYPPRHFPEHTMNDKHTYTFLSIDLFKYSF